MSFLFQGIQLVYMQHGREESPQGNKFNRFGAAGGDSKMTSFGMMPNPNTTTWQQQFMQSEQHPPSEFLADNPQTNHPS